MASAWSESEYWETVESIAEEALEEYPDDEESQEEFVRESVDGNQYILYDRGHEIVLSASSNEPDGSEVRAMSGPDADWRKQRGIAASMAMEQDALEKLQELRDEKEEEEEEEEEENPKRYRIISSAGIDLGTYPGETKEDALDEMARDAGYRDQSHAESVVGPFKGTIEEV